jgi:hypothetical protein
MFESPHPGERLKHHNRHLWKTPFEKKPLKQRPTTSAIRYISIHRDIQSIFITIKNNCMKKQEKAAHVPQAEVIAAQQQTIALQRRQLALQEVIFGKLFDYVQQLQQQWHTTAQDAKALGLPAAGIGQQSEG